jgi:hypothetical protein
MARLSLWKASRATDNENIFSAARKFLIRLGEEMLRATDEPCFFFAVHVIMRRAILCVNSHCGILEPERHAYDGSAGAAESRRQISISSFLDPEDARRDPREVRGFVGDLAR